MFFRMIIFAVLFFSIAIGADDCPSSSFAGTTKCHVYVDDEEITEGDDGTKTLTFKIHVSDDQTNVKDLNITYLTGDNTATEDDNDYDGDNGKVTIQKDQNYTTVSITINGDTLYENNETFDFNISIADESDDDADIGDGNADGNITNDDARPLVSWKSDDKDVKETNDDFNTTMTLQLDKKSGVDTEINITTQDGAATLNQDYNTTKTTLIIPAGKTEVDVNFTILGDTDEESTEDFNVTIDSVSNAKIDEDNKTRTINIKDDDSVDEVYVKDMYVSESDGTITVVIRTKSDDGAKKDFTIDWKTEHNTTDDDDLESKSGSLDFSQGDVEKKVTINIKDDDTPEDEERFDIKLSTDDEDVDTIDGWVKIKESDRLIIVGSKYDSPETREDNSTLEVIIRLIDPDEKAKNDIKVHIKSKGDTATVGEDYEDDLDDDVVIKAGRNSNDINITVDDDDEEEDNEEIDLNLTCVDCGNVEILEDNDTADIIDNDYAATLDTGEYNDTDNYYLRDGSGDKKYKRLFCTPINVWGDGSDDDNKVQISSPDDNVTQIFVNEDGNLSYDALYTNRIEITSDGGDGEICKEGTAPCRVQNLVRLGDKMEANRTWFYKDKLGDINETPVPKCESGDTIDIYNVDENGKQIYYTKSDNEWADCTVNFRIRDKNYTKPFLIEYVKQYDNDSNGDDVDKNTTFNVAPGFYYWKDVKFDGKIMLHVKEKIGDDDYSDAPYDIVRMYFGATEHHKDDGDDGYVFPQYSQLNFTDCNGDTKLDENDLACQNPSKFMYDFVGIDGNDTMIIVTEQEEYVAGYIFIEVPKRDTDDPVNVKFAKDTHALFSGGVNAWWIRLDPQSAQTIYWKKPNSDMKLFLGDGEKCIYTPNLYVESQNKSFKESEEDSADINITVQYFTEGTRKAMCENDWNITFDYNITQRYTDSADEEGNATQDTDYSADNYNGTVKITRNCSNCNKKSCWADNNAMITDFDVKYDKKDEPDELFDLNLSNPNNAVFHDDYNDTNDSKNGNYVMTIINVPYPKTLEGAFDIYDVNRADTGGDGDNSGYVGDDSNGNEDRNITTKVMNKEFTLTFGSFDLKDDTKLQVATDDDGNTIHIKYGLLKCPEANSSVDDCKKLTISDEEIFDDTEENRSFTINKLIPYAAAFVQACTKEKDDGNISLYDYGDCDDNTKCKDDDGNNQKCLRDVKSTDTFAIRPKEFRVENVPDQVVAGDEFNVTIKAVNDSGDEVEDYNYTISLGTDYNVTIEYAEDKDNCNEGNLDSKDKNFTNGEVNVTFTYDEVGKLNFKIKEVNEDQAFASVDKDENRSSEGLFIKDVNFSVKFVPDHFNIESNYKNYKDKDHTYISSQLDINSTLELNISARNSQDAVTKNYTDGCYSKDVTIDINHSTPQDSSITKLHYQISDSSQRINKSDDITFTIDKSSFADGEVNDMDIFINFDKNYSKAINPFEFNIDTIDAQDDDIESKASIDKNATFIYLSLDYPQSFSTYSKDKKVDVYYQYYKDDKWNDLFSHTVEDGDINGSKSQKVDIDIDTNINDAKQKVTFTYNSSNRPYKETTHFYIAPWLWYGENAKDYKDPSDDNRDCDTHPCIDALFKASPNNGWGGTGTKEKENDVDENTIFLK